METSPRGYGGIKMTSFGSFYGIITMISDLRLGNSQSMGCYNLITVQSNNGSIVNFLITPTTYFVNHAIMSVGDLVVGFYDLNAPVPLIYPPQFQAIVMSKLMPGQNVKVDYFNEELLSSDGTLKLNISPFTQIVLENGQIFNGIPANHDLIVIYGPTTRSIPAQTTPYKIIVICPKS